MLRLGNDISSIINTPIDIFEGRLNIYPDAEVAYSLDKLDKDYEGSAVRVRRTSDNQEQDIGFVDNLFDSASLEDFVDVTITRVSTDFSSSIDGTGETGLARNGNYTIGGRAGVLRGTIEATNEEHRLIITQGADTNANTHRLQTSIYIPSGQEEQGVDGVRIENGGLQIVDTITTKDEWIDIDATWTSVPNSNVFIKFVDSANNEIWEGNGTDKVYIDNVVITQSTADALVTTWYDQSGNGVDATQSTASKQPKIAVQGTYLGYVENVNNTGFATLNSTYAYVAGQRFTSFIVGQQFGNAVFGGTNSGSVYYGVSQDGNTENSRLGFENLSSFGNGVSVADSREDVASLMVNMALLTTLAQRNVGGGDALLSMGYTSGTFNNCRFKEYIIYNNQSVNREEVEANIMEHYNL